MLIFEVPNIKKTYFFLSGCSNSMRICRPLLILNNYYNLMFYSFAILKADFLNVDKIKH